jgi:hypothetical protein
MARKLGTSAALALLITMVFTSVAGALITAATGEVHSAPPPSSVALNQHEHDDDTGTPRGAHAFDEEQDYTTKAPIALDVCTTATSAFVTCPTPRGGRIRDSADLRPGSIPLGTCIDSHFLHADRPGLGSPTSGVIYEGSVTFDAPILGVIVTTSSLVASDVDPGLSPTTLYDATPTRGLELDTQADEFTINLSTNRVQFMFDVRTTMDQIRVITLGDADSCPGQAATLTLSPKAASNRVDTQHCVVATAKTETGGPAAGLTISFDVEGASELDTQPADEDATKTTDQNGTAEHCYRGPNLVGADAIHAYADNDNDGVEDVGTDPSDDATKTWLPADAETVLLDPKADENPVDTQHCVTATVRDAFGNPVPNQTVRFLVTGTVERNGSDTTDDFGEAEFCYSSRMAGLDVIEAFVDQDGDKVQDATEPSDMATKVWQPGEPATLELVPKLAENEVQTQHCVTATVKDAFMNPVPKVVVRFAVIGVNMTGGTDDTDGQGQATFCYTGGTRAGPDAITAFADSDKDGLRDATEPGDAATKTWLPLEPAILTLTPKTAENQVTDRPEDAHCVQAHVTDIFINPNPDILVRFTVTGTVELAETDETDEGGIAEFCYTSTTTGLDMIHAYADTDEDNVQDPEEPFDDATKLWQPGDPAVLTLTPETSVNKVETQHCVKAEVRDAFGNATPDRLVRFDVEGASEQDAQPADEDGSDSTDEFGNAAFCYTGPDLPGADTIHAYADNDEDNVEDPGEPFDDATKTWVLPPSTPGCEITIHTGGWILTTLGDKGSFGGNARIELDGSITRGEMEYHDHSALLPINFHSIEVLVVVCEALDGDGDGTPDGERASVYGTGEVNGIGPVDFRVRVTDRGEPGSAPGPDTYQVITAAYASGPEENPLQGGNVQIRRFD